MKDNKKEAERFFFIQLSPCKKGFGFKVHLYYFYATSITKHLSSYNFSTTIEKFEDTKGLIRSRKSKKDNRHNSQNHKRTNDYLQNITQKTKDRETRTPLKTRGELRYLGNVSSSCSICETQRVTLSTNPAISHEWGQDRIVITTNGSYPWSVVSQIFCNRYCKSWWRVITLRSDDFNLSTRNPWCYFKGFKLVLVHLIRREVRMIKGYENKENLILF